MSARNRLFRAPGDHAASSIVSTVLTLAVTVAAFGGASMAVMDQASSDETLPRADLQIKNIDGVVTVHHLGGDSIPADSVRLDVTTGGTRYLCTLPDVLFEGDQWTIGQIVDISEIFGDAEEITSVQVVYGGHSSAMLVSDGEAASDSKHCSEAPPKPEPCVAAIVSHDGDDDDDDGDDDDGGNDGDDDDGDNDGDDDNNGNSCNDPLVICHKPGTPAEKTKTIPSSAWKGHGGHGDTLGPCDDDDDDDGGNGNGKDKDD